MAKVTRTTNPLHFEDLEPHKFEDVVRGLLYDFRDWQNIEPTGKKGTDDGFDIRAWEKSQVVENESEEKEEDESKGEHPMEGNLWMIQCKREKEITPKKIEEILKDVDPKNPPYGYILAAATDFSKKSHDIFREILLKKGVTEFYLWGKAYLEDMLYLPKNDYILFTAFGISFNTRRRSKKTEIKFAINNKNKIFSIWGSPDSYSLDYKSVLIREFNDEKYPFEGEYSDFEKNPRWIECIPFEYHPLGMWVHFRQFYAYFDENKKQFDFENKADLLNRTREMRMRFRKDEAKRKFKESVSDFWERLPRKNQVKISIDGLIYFQDILVIDSKGDTSHDYPHIFLEFDKKTNKPFKHYRYTFQTNEGEIPYKTNFKRINLFPEKYLKQKHGRVHKKLEIPYRSIGLYEGKTSSNGFIFSFDGKYDFLKIGEIVSVSDDSDQSMQLGDRYLEITQIYESNVKDFTKTFGEHPYKVNISQQAAKEVTDSDKMTVIEVRSIPGWAIKKRR